VKLPAIEVGRPSAEDAEAIAELCNALAQEHYGEPVVDATEVGRWFGLPNLHLWVARAPDGRLAAYADLEEEDEGRRYWLDLREHPRLSGLGGARALLETTEAWARTRAAAGALFRGTVASPDESARHLFENAGYRFIRHMLEMRIELDAEPPEPQWPEGIRARTFVPGEDERSVYEADMEAFEDHWEPRRQPFDEWRAWTLEDPRFDASLWFLVEADESLAGFCLCGEHPSGDPTFGYVWILGVRRPWRRRGLGLALLQHAFREFRRRGMTRAGLDVDAENLTGAVRLYERAGMHVAKRRDIYEAPLRPG
jgi:mycothiol synthase